MLTTDVLNLPVGELRVHLFTDLTVQCSVVVSVHALTRPLAL